MLIQYREPTAPRYIYVDPVSNRVHLFMPIVGGVDIGADNTCRTAYALQAFFGMDSDAALEKKSALDELKRYRRALTYDLSLMQDGPLKAQKASRLAQIEQYIYVISDIQGRDELSGLAAGFPEYPDPIKHIIAHRTNLFSMVLRPSAPDGFLRAVNPVFSVDRNGDNGLYQALCDEFRDFDIPPQENPARKRLIAAVVASQRDGRLDIAAIQRELAAHAQSMFHSTLDATISRDATPITKEYIDGISFFDESASINDYVEAILNACVGDEFWNAIPRSDDAPPSLFDIPNTPQGKEQLSILSQFLLGQINIYCFANGLSTLDFGNVLDSNAALSARVATAITAALQNAASVEDAIFRFINTNYQAFGLTQPLNANEQASIQQRFETQFNRIKESPHFDEFTILDIAKPGLFLTHQGSICIDFADVIGGGFSDIDNQYFIDTRASSQRIARTAPFKNESVGANFELSDQGLAQFLGQLISDEANIDTMIELLLSTTDDGQKVFQRLTAATIDTLQRAPHWSQLMNRLSSHVTDDNTRDEINRRLLGSLVQISITGDMAYNLYVDAINRKGFAIYSPSGTDIPPLPTSPNELRQLLETSFGIAGIQSVAFSITGGFTIICPQQYVQPLQSSISSNQNRMYLNQPMAKAIYDEVARLYGRDSQEYIQMDRMQNGVRRTPQGNVPAPNKLREALRLLNININERHITYPGSRVLGYLITLNNQARRDIETIYQYHNQTQFHITRAMAGALYNRVNEMGHAGQIARLGPLDRIRRTLQLLGFAFRNLVSKAGRDGYLVNISPQVQQEIINTLEGRSERRSGRGGRRSGEEIFEFRQRRADRPVPARPMVDPQLPAVRLTGQGGARDTDYPIAIQPTADGRPGTPEPVEPVSLGRRGIARVAEPMPAHHEPARIAEPMPAHHEPARIAEPTPAHREPARIAEPTPAHREPAPRVTVPIPARSTATPAAQEQLTIQAVTTFRATTPAPNANLVQLSCPDSILRKFRELLDGTAILGCSFSNPYTNATEMIPAQANQLTARHLQLLARNESMNTNGAINLDLYHGRLNAEQVASLRCLIKATTVSGVTYATHTGGYQSTQTQLREAQRTIVIDKTCLQWGNDFRNTGGMFFYPLDPRASQLPQGYGLWQNQMYQAIYGATRPQSPSSDSLVVNWQGVQGRIDLNRVALAYDLEFCQALEAAVQQGNIELEPTARINFKFLNANLASFSNGLADVNRNALELARLRGIAVALERISCMPETQRNALLGKIGRIELPFSAKPPATNEVIERIRAVVVNRLRLEWGGAPNEDVYTPRTGFVNATTTSGNPHTMMGSTGMDGETTMDTAMSANAYTAHLNAAYNTQLQLRSSTTPRPTIEEVHVPRPLNIASNSLFAQKLRALSQQASVAPTTGPQPS